jgi:hypothetical protein
LGGGIIRAAWPFAVYTQLSSFKLPFVGYALVLVGHRLGDVHRTAWSIPSQQFGWDLLPLSADGWRLLHGEKKDSLAASDFAAFGREILAPAAGRVVSTVDAFACPMPLTSTPGRVPRAGAIITGDGAAPVY